jgi:hypothetical protein
MDQFKTEFHIPDSEWKKANVHRYGAGVQPATDLFYGDVAILVDSQPLLDPSPYNMSVADLASQLSALLLEGFPATKSNGLFRQLDDSLEIHFAVEGDAVIMHTGGRTLTVGRAAFIEGVTSFILEFARAAQRRVPKALKWKDLTAVQEFVATAVA